MTTNSAHGASVHPVHRPRTDYALGGESSRRAVEAGLSAAEWYHSEVPRKEMKALMMRRDGPAMRDTLLWATLHIVLGGMAIWLAWTGRVWLSVPVWLAYGVLYGSSCDSRWHECGHGTAFRTGWMNDLVYNIASFQVMRNPVTWRWSHARHHTDTYIVGRDAEISWMHPANLFLKAFTYVGVIEVGKSLCGLARQATGVLSVAERDYIPESEWPKVVFAARVHMGVYATTVLVAVAMLWGGLGWRALIPFLVIGGPRAYGCWHMMLTIMLQHGGLAEDVLDHRLNSRTVLLNPVSRWIYWNMNYHLEHHMFPMVPYYNLPWLHELIKHDLPPPNTSMWDGYKEMVHAVMRQRREPGYCHRKVLPPTARAYREELHQEVPERDGHERDKPGPVGCTAPKCLDDSREGE